ncbi:MAG: VirK/YbjX family protein [Megasphaera sp.]|jgi:uncharacterized protein VirK/YbjX|nr:VirK/YbjX family protein [Megasphaera sp.]
MDWQLLKQIGHDVYKCEDWRDNKRYYSFLARAFINRHVMEQHLTFFLSDPKRTLIMEHCPWLVDQAVRKIFYKNSTCLERAKIVQQHICWMEQLFEFDLMERIYVHGERVPLWRDEIDEKPFILYLNFTDGQQKEGCLSIELVYGSEDEKHTGWDAGTRVYQLMFFFGDTDLTIHIGALQGMVGGSDFIKKLTKKYFGYRPKNLMLWCLRCLAVTLNAKKITAVTNKGYYAMNHIRLDRKLKVDLDRFWQEAGGTADCQDSRFYDIPIVEYRKEMSEMKPSKRANHRRRYELMDQIQAEISKALKKYMKNEIGGKQ